MGKFIKGLLVVGGIIFVFMERAGLIVGVVGSIVAVIIYYVFGSGGDY